MSTPLERLVSQYAKANIVFPNLKPVTLAQWLLESARGTSELASEHNNFAGLKWRSEMVGFATPIEYKAHDGVDFYCKFSSLDDFIVGYWKFLSRAPYKGWEHYAAQGAKPFMDFVGAIYTPAAGYAEQVMSLLDEAEKRLNSFPSAPHTPLPTVVGAPTIIVIDPGHGGVAKVDGSSPNNASSPTGELEKNWTLDFAKRTRNALMEQALARGTNIRVILTRETDINLGLNARANVAKINKADLFLSIHMNGFDGKVRGVEALISEQNTNAAADLAFAQVIQDHVVASMNDIDPATRKKGYARGPRKQSLGVLNDIALGNTVSNSPCRACLVEIEFMDVVAVNRLFCLSPSPLDEKERNGSNRQAIANALAAALLSQI